MLLTLGIPGKPAPYMSGEPFHRCTHTAMCSERRHLRLRRLRQFAGSTNTRPTGKLLMSWGGPGTDPGEFNIVHNITCDADGWVYVADRENHRVQVFDGNGRYETQWNNLHRPCGLFMPPGKCPVCYIGELGPVEPVNRDVPEPRPARHHRRQHRQAPPRLGGLRAGLGLDQFLAPHGLTVSTAAATSTSARCRGPTGRNDFRKTATPDNLRSLHKFRKVG